MPYYTDWKPTKPEAADFTCRGCGSDDVWYRRWESDCGGHDDTKYECRCCRKRWWIE